MGCYQTKSSWKEEDLTLAKACLEKGNIEYRQKQYISALYHYETAYALEKKYFNDNEVLLAKSSHRIGQVYSALSSHKKAISFYKISLKTYLQNLKTDCQHSLRSVRVCQQIAESYEKLENCPKALKYNRKALHLVLLHLSRNHPLYASIHFNMGLLYKKMNCPNEGVDHLLTFIHLMKDHKRENHHSIAKCYNHLGLIYKAQGQLAKACGAYQTALDKNLALYGKSHLQTAVAFNNLALVQKDLQEFCPAFDNLLNCLKIELEHFSRKDPRIETTIQALYYISRFCQEGEEKIFQVLNSTPGSLLESLEDLSSPEYLDETRESTIMDLDQVESVEKVQCWSQRKYSIDSKCVTLSV